MGGKTISLKLSGLVPILAQYGFFVPCQKAKVGLSNYMQILIGDSQSVERGLSSFGSEMEELKEIDMRLNDFRLYAVVLDGIKGFAQCHIEKSNSFTVTQKHICKLCYF